MEFRVLGPFEVSENGHALKLGSRKQRMLLALLLLRAGEVVARDELAEQLWSGQPPPAADTAIRAYISRLRGILGAGRLETRAPGYMLVVSPDEFDARRFERLLADAGDELAQRRAGRLREALALWRGPALADFAYEEFAFGEIRRLEELRLTAVEERIDAELTLGLHAELVAELEALVEQNPLRERLRGQQMLALYRCGRQADALESYRQARLLLTGELGLEPAEEIKQLERAILAHDPAVDAPERVGLGRAGQDAGRAGVFVGRECELSQLTAGLEDAMSGRSRLFMVSGEPGIGKSRLADQLVREARRRGARVLIGRCWEAGGAPAFWPWVQALRAYVRDCEAWRLREQLGTGAADLAQILPELYELYDELPTPPSGDPEGARFRLFEATAGFLSRASLARPLVVIFDDLHAADAPSLLLLEFLADGLAQSRLLIVGCYRDVDPTLADPLAASLAALSRRPETAFLKLNGLSEHAVAGFISATAGVQPSPGTVSSIQRGTEGNPLFIAEIVRLLQVEKTLETMLDPSGRLIVPEGIRAVIRRRLRHLSSECELVLNLASVLGREFRLDALEQVSNVGGDHLLEILDEAARERVVAEVYGSPGRLWFTHALIRDSLYDELPPGRRAQLHRRVGDALEELYADNLDPHLAELAHHFAQAARPALADKALEYARKAGERALSLLAYEEAGRLFEVALSVLDNSVAPDEAVRCELLLAIGDANARAGAMTSSKAAYSEAARLADELELPVMLARAALGYGGRFIWEVSRNDPQLRVLLERALDALSDEDSALRVRLLARLAGGPLRDATADPARRHQLAAEAVEMARRIGEPSTLAYGLEGFMNAHHTPAFTASQVQLAEELVELALRSGELERAHEGYELAFQAHVELGEPDAARADLDAMSQLAEELRQPAQRWVVVVHRCLLALLEGRLDDAAHLIGEVRSLGERASDWTASTSYALQLYLLRREQGRPQEVEELIRAMAAENRSYPIFRCALASLQAELGSADEARADLDDLAADRFGAISFNEEWSVSMCLLAETASRLDERGHAATLYDLLLPYGGTVSISYPEISLGPISYFLGLLAIVLRRLDDAERHLADAIALATRIGARPWLERSRKEYGVVREQRASQLNSSAGS